MMTSEELTDDWSWLFAVELFGAQRHRSIVDWARRRELW